MTAILARILLSIALLVQGVGAIASEINAGSHPHCHLSAPGSHGKPAKMPCCHCDECTVPNCSTGCTLHGVAFIAAPNWASQAFGIAESQEVARESAVESLDSGPPLRPPIA